LFELDFVVTVYVLVKQSGILTLLVAKSFDRASWFFFECCFCFI